ADTHRQQGYELHQPLEAELGRLPRHAGDLDRAAQLALVLAADGKARQELPRALDDMPGLLDRRRQCATRTVGHSARLAEFLVVDDADDGHLDLVAERVFLLHQLGRCRNRDFTAVAQHDEGDLVAGAARNQALYVGKTLDLGSVDADEAVAGQDAGLFSG